MYTVFDMEADSLSPTVIYCVSYKDVSIESESEVITLTSYNEMRDFFSDSTRILCGHNIIRFDIPVVEKLLRIKVDNTLIDTLSLSWYLYPKRLKHGLGVWGEYYGVPKPKIESWVNLPLSTYINRCEEDVKINTLLFKDQFSYLWKIYNEDLDQILSLCAYLSFKLDCAREQEEVKWKLNIPLCKRNLQELISLREIKLVNLRGVMPLDIQYSKYSLPKVMYKKDGTMSVQGQKWVMRLVKLGLPLTHTDTIKFPTGEKTGNPDSIKQLKSWITALGWIPKTFKYNRDKVTGDVRKLEQINLPNGRGLCQSVKDLYSIEPKLGNLDELYLLRHRIGLLKGFLRDEEDGYIKAEIAGFTRTLRMKHSTIVNLPGVDKPYGEMIRGVLSCPEGYTLCGSDMSSLEDRTKQHLMYDYDPEYVESMIVPDFDPHINLAVYAGALTKEQGEEHKSGRVSHKKTRYLYKTCNYSATYGVGAATLSRTLSCSVVKAEEILKNYWKLNWSVKQIAKDAVIKTVNDQVWLYNPVSGYWITLRYKKDTFSALNQNLGTYCFDLWVMNVRAGGYKITFQAHDEIVVLIKLEKEEQITRDLKSSIKWVNKTLLLNRELDIDVQFGKNYAKIH